MEQNNKIAETIKKGKKKKKKKKKKKGEGKSRRRHGETNAIRDEFFLIKIDIYLVIRRKKSWEKGDNSGDVCSCRKTNR